MIAQVHAATLVGIEAVPIVVEMEVGGATPQFILVGLPDKAVEESRERVRSAMINCGIHFPNRKILCNLAPGDIRKEGPSLDLPIATAVMASVGAIPHESVKDTLILGELGLDGVLRPVDGALSVALMAAEKGFKRLIVPEANAPEAAVVTSLEVFGLKSLLDLVDLLGGFGLIEPYRFSEEERQGEPDYGVDYSDVKGQATVIRGLEIAAAGGHNLLMVGPPGSGKTMLARRFPTILPPLNLEEAVEVTRIHSAAGRMGDKRGLVWERPFRSPHHSASHAALVGGGKVPKPGEVSMGHKGVLFMDEMPEFDRAVLEALRQPLEDGVVTVSRVHSSLTFPADCILIGAMNPCPCGFKGLPEANCVSSPTTCGRYAGRISGPLLDRIDIHLHVPRVKPDELLGKPDGEPSANIRERVMRAREIQRGRLGATRLNGRMTPREIREMVPLDAACERFMKLTVNKMNISARVFDRILKVARTIADLSGSDQVTEKHLMEAVRLREQGTDG